MACCGSKRKEILDRPQIYFSKLLSLCSDITNTLVGISGETVSEGRNLRIY